MKFTRILAFALVGIMIVLSMASCGGSAVTNVKLKISIPSDEDSMQSTVYMDATDIEVPSEAPTVVDVLNVAKDPCKLEYNIEENANGRTTVKGIDTYEAYTDEQTGLYYAWHFTINGEIPDGHAGAVTVAEGDVIEYIFAPVITEE